MSYGPTQCILDKVLGMKRVNDRLVPKDLSLLQKQHQRKVTKETLDIAACRVLTLGSNESLLPYRSSLQN